MGALNLAEWQKLPISLSELCINTTLRCGQSFRWRKNDAGVWSVALHNRIFSLHQDPSHLYYRSVPGPRRPPIEPTPLPSSHSPPLDDDLPILKSYLNLAPSLTELYAQWSASDPNFARLAPHFAGIRILAQPAWEALVCFICSSNNNIARITQMVGKLCAHYGEFVGEVDGEAFHDFPPPERLAAPGVEARLRELGFGYRAGYIYKTACAVREKGVGWLEALGNPGRGKGGVAEAEGKEEGEWVQEGREGYRAAREALLELQGVGPKVADCVCLMGLGWGEAVPVDTHVWQIAVRDYRFGGGKKNATMTKGVYEAVGNKFRALWGKEAGWAHSVLFTADLRAFSERLVAKDEKVEVKKENGEEVKKIEKVVRKRIKREDEEGERKVIQVETRTLRSKRQRMV